MAALFQLVPVVPVGIAPTGGGGYSPLAGGGVDSMNRLGGACTMQMPQMPGMGMGYGADPMQAMMTQLVGLLANLLMGQASGQTQSPSSTTGSTWSTGSSSSGAGAGAVDASQFSGGTENSRKLAAAAKAEATNGDSNGGLCFRDVSRALKSIGVNTSGASAYMAADQLAQNSKVKEIKVPQSELSKLPPGAIVVWDKGPGHPHGHISVSTGDGKEASDIMRNQITNYGTSFRVFMPV